MNINKSMLESFNILKFIDVFPSGLFPPVNTIYDIMPRYAFRNVINFELRF